MEYKDDGAEGPEYAGDHKISVLRVFPVLKRPATGGHQEEHL